MLTPPAQEANRLTFEPREKSDVVRGCTLLCALGDADLASKVEDLKRLRGAFTHLLVLADVPCSQPSTSEPGLYLWRDKWPTGLSPTRERAGLTALAVRNIELLGGLGFELHLALFNADACEQGMGGDLGSCGYAAGFGASVDCLRQLPHELAFVRWLLSQPCVRHITGIMPCFGGSSAATGDLTMRLIGDIKGCGYAGSILHNLGGEARTLFGPKLRRAGALSVCDIRNEGEWMRTSCDIRSAIGFAVHPAHTVAAVRQLCESPGAVGYYMDFGSHAGVALPSALLVAAGASASKALEEPLPAAPSVAVAQGGPSDAATPLWKPLPGGTCALLRLPDIAAGLPVPVENIPCTLCAYGTVLRPANVHREVYKDVPIVAYVFDLKQLTGPATLVVARSDASVFTFDVSDVWKREYLQPTLRNVSVNVAPQQQAGFVAAPAAAPVVNASAPAAATEVVEDLATGRLTVPVSWYTRPPITVSYAYDISGAKRRSVAAQETSPGVFCIGAPISKISHPVGTQPNVWILKFEPHTVVDSEAMVHEVGNYWYVYVENGKLRDR